MRVRFQADADLNFTILLALGELFQRRADGGAAVNAHRPAAEELILIWSATEAEEWVDRIVVLPL